MVVSEASLIVMGPITAADEHRILWMMRPALWRELRQMLRDEDVELRYGVTTQGAEAIVQEVRVHFRVSDLAAAVVTVRRLYAASGLPHRAAVCAYGAESQVVADYLVHPGGDEMHT